MRITVKDNEIICTQDNFNAEFWRLMSGTCFTVERQKDFNYSYVNPLNHQYGEGSAFYENDKRLLWLIIYYADKFNIEIDDIIRQRYDEVTEKYEYYKSIEKANEEKEKKKKHWQFRQAYGCKYCENLRYDIDQPWCKAIKEKLEEKNCRDYDKDGVYQLFKYFVPFPSDNCPFKI